MNARMRTKTVITLRRTTVRSILCIIIIGKGRKRHESWEFPMTRSVHQPRSMQIVNGLTSSGPCRVLSRETTAVVLNNKHTQLTEDSEKLKCVHNPVKNRLKSQNYSHGYSFLASTTLLYISEKVIMENVDELFPPVVLDSGNDSDMEVEGKKNEKSAQVHEQRKNEEECQDPDQMMASLDDSHGPGLNTGADTGTEQTFLG